MRGEALGDLIGDLLAAGGDLEEMRSAGVASDGWGEEVNLSPAGFMERGIIRGCPAGGGDTVRGLS